MKRTEEFSINLVSPALRATNAIAFGVVLAGEFLYSYWPPISLASIAILAITAIGALFEERWVFDAKGEVARFRFGLVFLAHTRSIPFSSIASVEFDDFERGFRKVPWTRIVLRVRDGKDEVLDSVNRKHAEKTIANAERLAAYFASRSATQGTVG